MSQQVAGLQPREAEKGNGLDLKRLVEVALPTLLLVVVGFAIAYQFVEPAPPRQIAIATGRSGGAYQLFGERYREILARDGVTLQVLETAGSIANARRLQSDQSGEVVALIQGGVDGGEGLVSLGSLYYEPLWVFTRGPDDDRLPALRGLRLGIGEQGSGTHALALQLLADNGIDSSNSQLSTLGAAAATQALLGGQLDAIFLVAAPVAPLIQQLLRSDDVHLMSFARAAAYSSRNRFLTGITLPEGVFDLELNIPDRDITLLATAANLAANRHLHPALTDLLIQAAQEVHGEGGVLETRDQFPAPRLLAFPLSPEAERFYENGPSFLQRYLPFWAATFVDRMKVMLVPLVALLYPLFRIMPPIYRWRVRSRIYRLYHELATLELEMRDPAASGTVSDALAQLEHIESKAMKLKVPRTYTDLLYSLRVHIDLVRAELRRDRGEATAG